MRRAVVYPQSAAVLYSGGGGGSTALHPLILKQSTISTVAAACHEDTTQANLHGTGRDSHPPHTQEGGPNTTTPSPAWLHSSRHSKSILGN
ncbi:Hypothetical protein FKW44_020775 [Caligus rogercresseyi]|uniref:Uncharacterized protein n=1 Tax=Caligus rogercresseyi TaxID=217165 RepID=A0A7T8GQV2_CALRO|nr:Hypothetical protein FKW44_020775 [Caligus rogercresseyi]